MITVLHIEDTIADPERAVHAVQRAVVNRIVRGPAVNMGDAWGVTVCTSVDGSQCFVGTLAEILEAFGPDCVPGVDYLPLKMYGGIGDSPTLNHVECSAN